MTKTREELIARALNKLGVIGAGQSASAEDALQIDGTIGPVMSDLSTRGIWSWGNPDELDEDAFEHLAEILANANARDYGKQPDEVVRRMAENRLRMLDIQVLSGQPVKVEYF